MNKNGALKMICYIDDFEEWDDKIYENSIIFFEKYNLYPNILQASKETWNKIDEYAKLFNPENLIAEDEKTEENQQEGEIKLITTFITSNFKLEFCINEKIKKDYFIILFDEAPIFDGEEIINENKDEYYQRIA